MAECYGDPSVPWYCTLGGYGGHVIGQQSNAPQALRPSARREKHSLQVGKAKIDMVKCGQFGNVLGCNVNCAGQGWHAIRGDSDRICAESEWLQKKYAGLKRASRPPTRCFACILGFLYPCSSRVQPGPKASYRCKRIFAAVCSHWKRGHCRWCNIKQCSPLLPILRRANHDHSL
jgi:hypothetical protein